MNMALPELAYRGHLLRMVYKEPSNIVLAWIKFADANPGVSRKDH